MNPPLKYQDFKRIDMIISGVPIDIIEFDTSTYLVCLFNNKLGDICISVNTRKEADLCFYRLRCGKPINCYGYVNKNKSEFYKTLYLK